MLFCGINNLEIIVCIPQRYIETTIKIKSSFDLMYENIV